MIKVSDWCPADTVSQGGPVSQFDRPGNKCKVPNVQMLLVTKETMGLSDGCVQVSLRLVSHRLAELVLSRLGDWKRDTTGHCACLFPYFLLHH